jgi:hypothetical protein
MNKLLPKFSSSSSEAGFDAKVEPGFILNIRKEKPFFFKKIENYRNKQLVTVSIYIVVTS